MSTGKRKIFVTLSSICLFLLIFVAVHVITQPGQRMFEMLFHRSFVQYITVYVFVLVTTLLCWRLVTYMRSKRQLCLMQTHQEWRTLQNLTFGKDTDAIKQELIEHGGGGTLSCVIRLAKLRKKEICKAYEKINFLVCCLPAFGLFGTMMGLSQSLFAAFAGGNVGPEAIKQFVAALGTALDTTVLALGCALVAGGFAWLMNHIENELNEQQAYFAYNVLSDKLQPKHTGNKPVVSTISSSSSSQMVFRAELRALTTEILKEAFVKFDNRLHDVSESCRLSLRTTVKGIIREQRVHELEMVKKLTADLNRSINQIGTLIERHNTHAVKAVASRLGHIAGTLDKRIPSELIVRYERNGQSKLERDDDI